MRRPASAASAFVRELLLHLERAGSSETPRHLGQDDRGRDIFEFIPGEVAPRFRRFEDAQVAEAGAMLRRFHDATRGSRLAGEAEVVCHHDAAPNNTIFRAGRPVALIDFDFAAPGSAVDDLAYTAWTWCVASKPERGPMLVQAAQLRLLADAYGLPDAKRPDLVSAMIARQGRNISFWGERMTGFEGPASAPGEIQERVDWSRREMRFTLDNRAAFVAALLR